GAEPGPLGQFLRVEAASPVAVLPAAGSDVDHSRVFTRARRTLVAKMIVLILILVLLAVSGILGFVVKVALGVAIGLILAVAIGGWLVSWRIRRLLKGPRSRWRPARGSSSTIACLDRGRRPQDARPALILRSRFGRRNPPR